MIYIHIDDAAGLEFVQDMNLIEITADGWCIFK